MDGSSLAISARMPEEAHVESTTSQPAKAREKGKKKPLQLSPEITNLENDNLITNQRNNMKNHRRSYRLIPFVLAGTGYGKSRIAELYFHLYAPEKKPVVLVLNPLDSLGEDQVREKTKAGIKAISLGKMKLTKAIVEDIKRGDYAFVYLSPEVFLNNPLFTELYFSNEFQSRLVLLVLDEAHMVYVWGLVESGKAKFLSVRDRLQDYGIFRPSYGKLGDRLMATNGVPILLLSATCRPVAIDSILGSLMLKPVDITFFRGELVRTEIRILRFYMEYPLKSCEDLLRMFSKKTEIKDKDLLPTLICSGTRKATLAVINVLNKARGKKRDAYSSKSSFIRRYMRVPETKTR
ncbi:hypothetical protein PTTG_11873 [Puccinia triticina 1-1 BBBD Race 1]|uniref:DNA 3'-5' helicase n=1 Tax=Puccinia triticina (isolate 1-1 / race 1 (BBBD)) TaxID=630390 RepID=A0A180H0L4_PUCT1|nr:hypothetical protein PTTG_11873 [Puccinia triticina 1-1 BBBD Race 1]